MKNVHKKKRQFVTLIEIMIVMFIISLILGVLAVNYGGALTESKAFKTRAGIERLESILNLAAAADPDLLDDLESNWQGIVKKSPLVSNPNVLIKDGWGEEYDVSVEDGRIVIKSEKFEEYKKANPSSSSSGGK